MTTRRDFLEFAGAATGLGMADGLPAASGRRVSLVVDPNDKTASTKPAQWAARELEQALNAKNVPVQRCRRAGEAASEDLCVVVAGLTTAVARDILGSAKVSVAGVPEALGIVPGKTGGRPVLLVCGHDSLGLVYALAELTDRVQHSTDPVAALNIRKALAEQPANRIRSVTRCFVSDVEDKPWYNNRSMWPKYLSMLVAQRFNRFSIAFGIGYDFLRNIRDCYFHFAYPFLVSVPGYNVRAVPLPDAERDHNLEMLRYISEETAMRGLDFHLALWTHGYQWIDSPNANYLIEGLTPENHAAYCRDALQALLEACPAIHGVTFRVHGESGVPEGDYSFWKTVFDGIVRSGRKIGIDLHAKGINQKMIDVALSTGMPVTVAPKFWAEHQGLPYHQAAIREQEMPPRSHKDQGFFALSSGSRKFMRYGYGDLLTKERRYGVLFRIWPGTQRVLLWGDPVMAAGYGRAFHFCGSDGVDIFEPLSFKGRKGSGMPGGRCAYADASLKPGYDWEKFLYTYRVWGRHLYNPDADPETWRRSLRKQFRAAAPHSEAALGYAGQILPLITTAHGPSAANATYWPEIYTNMPIVDAGKNHLYHDTPSPKRFGTVSPFDPQLFSRVDDCAGELLSGERSGKYSPIEVAQWLEDRAESASRHLAEARPLVPSAKNAEFRRLGVDVAIQSGLGRFFAWKLRSGVLYALYEQSGDRSALQEALTAYRSARKAWVDMADGARGIYAPDITYGYDQNLRGHWLDRLPAIDDDIADMEKKLAGAAGSEAATSDREKVKQAIREVLTRPRRSSLPCRHTPAASFRPGRPLKIELALDTAGHRSGVTSASLYYRHVNQAELYRATEMEAEGTRYSTAIPGDYTQSPFPMEYYFVLRNGHGEAWIYPGFDPSLSNQPYFVVRQA